MEFDTSVKLAVYRHFAETGRRPSPAEVAGRAGADVAAVLDAYQRLRAPVHIRSIRTTWESVVQSDGTTIGRAFLARPGGSTRGSGAVAS